MQLPQGSLLPMHLFIHADGPRARLQQLDGSDKLRHGKPELKQLPDFLGGVILRCLA